MTGKVSSSYDGSRAAVQPTGIPCVTDCVSFNVYLINENPNPFHFFSSHNQTHYRLVLAKFMDRFISCSVLPHISMYRK